MTKKLIRFTAGWCSACKTMAPVIDKIAGDMGIELRVVDIEDENDAAGQKLRSEHAVRGLPTYVLLDEGGKYLDRVTGAMGEAQIADFLEQN